MTDIPDLAAQQEQERRWAYEAAAYVPDPTVEADEPCERCGLIEACMCGEPRHDL